MTALAGPAPIGLQAVRAGVAPTAEATALALEILESRLSVDRSVERVAELFAALPRVDTVVAALTTLGPEDHHEWHQLGERAWVREWRDADSPCRVVADDAEGPEAALTMPYLSQYLRYNVVAIPSVTGLPPEGDQDRREMEQCGAKALLAGAQVSDGTMYGSVSLGSGEVGDWPETYVADLRLLNAALSSRMAAEDGRRSTAEAIALAELARTQQQQFFATIGHELRTPLSAIMGYAEVLADEVGDRRGEVDDDLVDQVEQDSGRILRAGEQLLAIVEDLLSTGRVLGAEEARADQDVAAAVEDVIHWHRTPAIAHGVSISCDVPPGTKVHARASGLRQVLTNLIGNAIVHNRRGGTVLISATESLGEGREPRVRISVRDTGRGLTSEEVRRVFEPFVRFAVAGVKGTGLGLPLARAVAERDGGMVGAESTPGRGSVFWLDLPASG